MEADALLGLSDSEPIRLVAKEDVVITLSTGESVEIEKGERVVVDPVVEVLSEYSIHHAWS